MLKIFDCCIFVTIIGSVSYPTNLTVRAISSSSVEANWTQPSSADSVWQYYTNHTITCTSTHGVYTATQHVNVSVAVNETLLWHNRCCGVCLHTESAEDGWVQLASTELLLIALTVRFVGYETDPIIVTKIQQSNILSTIVYLCRTLKLSPCCHCTD